MKETSDTQLSAFAISRGHVLQRIQGPVHRRVFVFQDEIPDDLIVAFYSSAEKKALDAFRTLKMALARM
jgi:hypothetical protein